MTRVRAGFVALAETFWFVPGLMVIGGIGLGEALVDLDRSGIVPKALVNSPWLYGGSATGARTLLGAVASSTIGVAGTVFSITIAALSLAAGQMGPRLLRNFTHDRGNQATLGVFLATFSFALIVLRSVRTVAEHEFVPHVALSVALLLAFVCVGTLVFFVGHMADRINVDNVIEVVSKDLRASIRRARCAPGTLAVPRAEFWSDGRLVIDRRRGYVREISERDLSLWAAERGVAIRMLVRPGGYVFPGAPIAIVKPDVEGVGAAIASATVLTAAQFSAQDLEYPVRSLVEVAVRALSPGINDPHTAISVIDRLGAGLCEVAEIDLERGVFVRDGKVVLVVPSVSYDGLVEEMYGLIRQNAAGSAAVLRRMLEVLTVVLSVERRPGRVEVLQRQADVILSDGERDIETPGDLARLRACYESFVRLRREGALALLTAAEEGPPPEALA